MGEGGLVGEHGHLRYSNDRRYIVEYFSPRIVGGEKIIIFKNEFKKNDFFFFFSR